MLHGAQAGAGLGVPALEVLDGVALAGEPALGIRHVGVNGSAYLVGGLGMTVLANNEIPERSVYVVPIRSGVGARLGINIGYLKFTSSPTWNPF